MLTHLSVDVNYLPLAGNTPLNEAITRNKLDIAQKLLDAGANINALDQDKQSILSRALALELPKDTIGFLLKKKSKNTMQEINHKSGLIV